MPNNQLINAGTNHDTNFLGRTRAVLHGSPQHVSARRCDLNVVSPKSHLRRIEVWIRRRSVTVGHTDYQSPTEPVKPLTFSQRFCVTRWRALCALVSEHRVFSRSGNRISAGSRYRSENRIYLTYLQYDAQFQRRKIAAPVDKMIIDWRSAHFYHDAKFIRRTFSFTYCDRCRSIVGPFPWIIHRKATSSKSFHRKPRNYIQLFL